MTARVLIVDDSKFMRSLLRAVLEDEHVIVGEAGNGVEAIVGYEEHDPDVVTMNVKMPIKDGIEATAEITEDDPDARVIICTSSEQEAVMKRAIEANADGYVTKPFQKESLLEAIDDALSL